MNLFIFLALSVITSLYHDHVMAQENMSQHCFSVKDDCEEFKKCCHSQCPFGATVVCLAGHSSTHPTAHEGTVGDTGFMAGGAPEEATTHGPELGTAAPDAQCVCVDQAVTTIPMTNACLGKLDTPDQCPAFEKCCEAACSTTGGHAYLCKQNPDGSSTADTECSCFNSVPEKPGSSDKTTKEKDKKDDETPHLDKVKYEDSGPACFNHSDNCKAYEECCVEACKTTHYEGKESLVKMCIGNKYNKPMISTHTFCLCPIADIDGLSHWGSAAKGEEVSQVFKGGSDYDYDGVANISPMSVVIYILMLFCSYTVSKLIV